jgi:hypothetical protein
VLRSGVVRLDHRTVPGDDTLDRLLALEALDGGLGKELDSVISMEV